MTSYQMSIGEAVAETGMQPTNGWEPVVVTMDKAGKPINHLLSACADQLIDGRPHYLTSGWFDPADISKYQGRKKENCRRVPWLPFDFDLGHFLGLPAERIHAWPQKDIADCIDGLEAEIDRIFVTMGLPVHRLEYTGHGLAAYVYVPKHGPEEVVEYQRLHGALVDRINVLAGETLADPQVRDAGARFMRLVPSLNTKSDPPRQTETLRFIKFVDAPVTLDQLREAAGPSLRDDPPPRIVPIVGELLPAETVDQLIELVRPSWQLSNRHAVALGLSGMLAKAGVPQEQAAAIVGRLAQGDEELSDRLRAVETSYSRVRSGQDVRGFYKLRETIDDSTLTWIDQALDGIRKATNPYRLIIGGNASYEDVRVGVEVHEFRYEPLPDSALIGWVAEYVGLMLPTTEAPVAFHYAAGMVMAGAAIGRRVAIRSGAGVLFPNLFALFIGRSAWSRKDTSIRRATSLLRGEVTHGTTISTPVRVISNISSAEGLVKTFHEVGPNIVFELLEFAETLQNADRKSTSNLPARLITLYDMPPVIENLTKTNPISVTNPVASIMAAIQPSTLAEAMRSLHITSGFANRFWLVCGDSRGPMALADPVDWQRAQALYQRLHGYAMAYREGTVLELSDDARSVWERWYVDQHWHSQGTPEEDAMRGRHQDLILKLALMYAVTDQSDTVTASHLNPAMAVLDWSWAHTKQLMGEWGQRLDNEIENRMIAVLQARGNMKRHDLFRSTRNRKWTTAEMVRVFESLIKTERMCVDPFGVIGLGAEEHDHNS